MGKLGFGTETTPTGPESSWVCQYPGLPSTYLHKFASGGAVGRHAPQPGYGLLQLGTSVHLNGVFWYASPHERRTFQLPAYSDPVDVNGAYFPASRPPA